MPGGRFADFEKSIRDGASGSLVLGCELPGRCCLISEGSFSGLGRCQAASYGVKSRGGQSDVVCLAVR